MRFIDYFEDLLVEGRTMANEKFEWVTNNLGNWLFNELYLKPDLIKSLPNIDQFRTYVGSTIKKSSPTESDLVENLYLLETFLNRLDQKESANFIRTVIKTFPNIAVKILRYGKPEPTGSKRGRPAGSKNKPKFPSDINVDITTRPEPEVIEPQITEPEVQVTPKRAGRPKIYDDEFTAAERSKYKREGPAMIKSLEAKAESLDNELNVIVQRIKKIMNDIDKRKKYFGIE